MKVYFNTSHRGIKFFNNYYKLIYQYIKDLGYQINYDKIITVSSNDFYETVEKGGRTSHLEIYNENIKSMQEADIMVFEGSLPSLSMGFLIQKAVSMNKPTIVLYLKDNTPVLLVDHVEEKLIVKSYSDDNLKDVVKESLDQATEIRDKRFNFFISPDLLTYLNNASKDQGITKSTFIRNLLLEHKRRQTT